MSYIDASRFNALKARVIAECTRRCYTGSVVDYASANYDFTVVPGINKVALEEHYEKLAAPLSAINSDLIPGIDGDRVIQESDLEAIESALDMFRTRDMGDRTQGDCKTSCTGACYTECSTTCTGGCGQQCQGTCTGSCKNTCRGTCSGCDGCSGCGSGCASGCYGSCQGSCKEDCTVTCGYCGCKGSCETSCVTDCYEGCSKSCGQCGNNCQSACTSSCSGLCTSTAKST